METKAVLLGIFSSIASYIELTITGPFRVLAEHEAPPAMRKNRRARKDSEPKPFSLVTLLQKQRMMCSPETNDVEVHGSPREHYVEHTYCPAPSASRWTH